MIGIMPLLLGLFYPAFAWSARLIPIEIEWAYTPPPGKIVTSYQLYQEGIRVCRTTNPNHLTMECSVQKSPGVKTATFTLGAEFSDGTRSPLSAPYHIELPPFADTQPILMLLLSDQSS